MGFLSNTVDDAVKATAKIVVAPFKVGKEMADEWDAFWDGWDDSDE